MEILSLCSSPSTRGISLTSKAIKFLTRGPYSHSAFLFDKNTEAACSALVKLGFDFGELEHISDGSVVEAWMPKVRSTPRLSFGHEIGTVVDIFELRVPLSQIEETLLVKSLVPEIGTPYNRRDVLRFITRRPGNLDDTWFCSELLFQKFLDIMRALLAQTQAWEVSPSWIQRSPFLRYVRSETTV